MFYMLMHTCELLLNLPASVSDKITKSSRTPCFHRTSLGLLHFTQQRLFKDAILRLNNRAGLISSTNQVMNFTGDLNLTSATAGDRITVRINPFHLLLLLFWCVEN
jgi:hypothetical protein